MSVLFLLLLLILLISLIIYDMDMFFNNLLFLILLIKDFLIVFLGMFE